MTSIFFKNVMYFIFLKEAEDLHWKVSRTRMWMNWVNKGSVLPPPYNLIPNPKAVIHLFRKIRNNCQGFNQVSCNLRSKLIEKQKLTGRLGERIVRQETEKERNYRIYPFISRPFKT